MSRGNHQGFSPRMSLHNAHSAKEPTLLHTHTLSLSLSLSLSLTLPRSLSLPLSFLPFYLPSYLSWAFPSGIRRASAGTTATPTLSKSHTSNLLMPSGAALKTMYNHPISKTTTTSTTTTTTTTNNNNNNNNTSTTTNNTHISTTTDNDGAALKTMYNHPLPI